VFGLISPDYDYQISKDELAACSIDLPQTLGLLIKPNQSMNLEDESLPNGEAIAEGSSIGPILTPFYSDVRKNSS
jgi:hypothetical protein